jgi:Outer membrane protein beta-barrel domain
MRKKSITILALIGIILLGGQMARAQSAGAKEYRFELGAQVSLLRFQDFSANRTEPGLGARFTFNATNHIAVEGEVNFFPRDKDEANLAGGLQQITQGLFGIKAGKRGEKAGVFGKVRPGFVHYGVVPGIACIALVGVDCTIDKTNFAVDVGGVVELYPTRRTLVRFDAGDTIIRRSIVGGTKTTNNLQLSAGFGVRF